MKTKLKYLAYIISLSLGLNLNAQDFNWEAQIIDVKSDGFQKLQLLPTVVSKLTHNFGDIRIYDNSGKEIPYILEVEQAYSQKDYFVEYKIIEKKEQTSWPYYTRIVIHNPAKNKISNFQLIIKNSDVSKNLKLSGSDDNKNWYSIKDNYRFQALYSDFETSVIKIIDFPVSNYEFYEILIDDWKNNPINVLKAGFFNTSIEKGKYTEIEKPGISQLELKDEKQSLIKIGFSEQQLFNKITLNIEGPEFYFRDAQIQVRDSIADKRNKYQSFFNTLANITISSSSTNTFYFDSLWTKEFYIRISNHDDQPLKITSVNLEQLNHYLICKLESTKSYKILFGNGKIASPVYDIKYFSDKIPEKIPILKSAENVFIGKMTDKTLTGFRLDKKFIWAAIGLVVCLLFYMVLRMLKEMKKQNKT